MYAPIFGDQHAIHSQHSRLVMMMFKPNVACRDFHAQISIKKGFVFHSIHGSPNLGLGIYSPVRPENPTGMIW